MYILNYDSNLLHIFPLVPRPGGNGLTTRHVLECISAGCPKLKSLTLDSNMWDLEINRKSLKELRKGCKELKDLKLFQILCKSNNAEDDIKKIFPDCNVEIKECDLKLWMKMNLS